MSAEPRRISSTDAWTAWEHQVVNGLFPLRRFLGGSDHSAVFLTEYTAQTTIDAAIKFVPAHPLRADAQLVQWGAAATVTHPNLVRIFDMGRCQLGGHAFLYIVMEYAEQTLAQVLPKRALTSDEVGEMLAPTLDALSYLHRNHLVHARIKPSNIVVVNDRLKLASDGVRPTGSLITSAVRITSYDPPELREKGTTTEGDMWSLGITLVEALTQRPPLWSDNSHEVVALPTTVPDHLAYSVRACLSRVPAERPVAAYLANHYKAAPQPNVSADAKASAHGATDAAAAGGTKTSFLVPAIVITCALLIFIILWSALRSPERGDFLFSASAATSSSNSSQLADTAGANATPVIWEAAKMPEPNAELPPTVVEPVTVTPSQSSSAVANTAALATSTTGGSGTNIVLNAVPPEVPSNILRKVRGTVKVTVRVLVDPAGNVVGDLLEKPAQSAYFANRAREAASGWKFSPTEERGSRVWLLRFDFTPNGIETQADFVQ